MLKKVFRYDFTALFSEMMPLLLAALAVDLIFLYSLRGSGTAQDMPAAAYMIVSLVCFAVMIAMVVVLFIRQMYHFYDDVYGRHAYFMMTLPVSEDAAILGRLLSAFLMDVITFGICLLPLMHLYGMPDVSFSTLFPSGGDTALQFVMLAAAVLSSTLALYFCIALGMLWPAHHTVISIICFVLFFALNNWLASPFMGEYSAVLTMQADAGGTIMITRLQGGAPGWLTVLDVIIGAVCYAGTRWLLRNRLNVA